MYCRCPNTSKISFQRVTDTKITTEVFHILFTVSEIGPCLRLVAHLDGDHSHLRAARPAPHGPAATVGTPQGEGLSLPRVKSRHSFTKGILSSRAPKWALARGTAGAAGVACAGRGAGLRLHKSARQGKEEEVRGTTGGAAF